MLLGSSDERLVELVLGGSDAAFEVLFDRHVADSLWFAHETLGAWDDAEEAVRHSFAAARAYLASRSRGVEFAPWLHTILSNHCLSMLQARTPAPGERRDSAAVVDLDEWRHRRGKRLGAVLPVAPSAAFHESVMAACGIGGGTAAAGAPLLGGTLAKVAVVAVLAGGAGVAGNVAPDRAAPADAGTGVAVKRTVEAASGSPARVGPVWDPSGRVRDTRDATVRELRNGPLETSERLTPGKGDPARQAPSGGATPAAEGGPAHPATPSLPNPPVAAVPAAAQTQAQTALGRVAGAVKARVPAVAEVLTRAQLPNAAGLSKKIGDDLGVAVTKAPADLRALLSRGTNAPPK